ncbi:MAG TPA: hypothetical protein VGG75_13925 [Trebonia sp.]|jgi:hypothetical protein
MPRGWNQEDPEKGMPYRHTRAKIKLLLSGLLLNADGEVLHLVLLKLAEKHPDDVLAAVADVMAEREEGGLPDVEFRLQAAKFIAANDGLMKRLAAGEKGERDTAELLQALADDGIPTD